MPDDSPPSNFSKYAWKVFTGALVGAFAFRHARKACASRSKTTTVELSYGDTLGDLITKYVGDYTDSNVDSIRKLNKNIHDIDFLQPGDKLVVPDNRKKQELATAEADWWRGRARTGQLKEPKGPAPASEVAESEDQKKDKKAKGARRWGFGAPKEPPSEEPKHKIKLLQDEW